MLARLTVALGVTLALLAALPAFAAAAFTPDTQRVYDDYRSDGTIAPCDHTAALYRATLQQLTPAVEEETPAFRPAVEAALEERKVGCKDLAGGAATAKPKRNGTAAAGKRGRSSTATPASPSAPAATPAAGSGGSAPAPSGSAPATPADGGAAPAATPAPVATPAPAAPAPAAAPTEQVLADHPYVGTPTGLLIAAGLLALTLLAALAALAARHFGWGEERLAGTRHAWGEAAYRAGGTWGDFVDWLRLGR